MNEQKLSEELAEEIKQINEQIADLYLTTKRNYEDLLKEVEYRRSLGEDI